MYKLRPLKHSTIWGGTRLSKYTDDVDCSIGHLYLVSGHPEMSTVVEDYENGEIRLCDLFNLKKREWGMSDYEEFPLTIALVDAKENLSIQVHPNDEIANILEGKRLGKEESWYFLEAPDDGWLYAGCKCANRKELIQAVRHGNMEEITNHETINAGDYVCIKPGTLHAMTAGCLVFEIEFGGDFTYRFYDYGRKMINGSERELHVEKAIKAIDLSKKTEIKRIRFDQWIREDNYELIFFQSAEEYVNEGSIAECVIDLQKGLGAILLAGETYAPDNMDGVVVIRIKS